MKNRENTTVVPEVRIAGTYDLASPTDRMKAIDLTLRHYFGGDNWLVVRNKQLPGLKRNQR